MEQIIPQLGKQAELKQIIARQRPTPSLLVLRAVIDNAAASENQREQRAGAALVEAETQLQRGLRILAVLAAAAPSLGLLGTVTGMIGSFQGPGYRRRR